MDRRDFIGSIIGFVGGVAFTAKEPDKFWVPPVANKPQYKAVIVGPDGDFQAPGIAEVIHNPTNEVVRHDWFDVAPNAFAFLCNTLNVIKAVRYDGVKVFDKNGLFQFLKFKHTIHMVNSDSLRVCAAIEPSRPVTIEEAINANRKKLINAKATTLLPDQY